MSGRKVIGECMNITTHTTAHQPYIMPAHDNRRPPSAPILDLPHKQWTPPAATVRPTSHISMPAHRTLSMPQLSPERDAVAVATNNEINKVSNSGGLQQQQQHNIYAVGPPKPPRSMRLSAPAVPDRLDKAEIRSALQNWQLGMLEGNKKTRTEFAPLPQGSPRGSGDGQTDSQGSIYQKKVTTVTNRRREPRRHTLQNGIDYNMLKRLKQIEQEKDVLLQGLAAVEKARDWYLKQVAIVQDKIKYLGRTGTTMVSASLI